MTTIPANYSTGTATYSARDDRTVRGWGEVSWGPIMMGAVCAIGLQFIFTVLGIALGASAGDISSGVDSGSVRTVGIAAGLWWLITGTIALAAGGFVFGRLSGLSHHSFALHLEAAAMWGVVALFGFLVIWSGTGMLSEAASPIAAISVSSIDPSAQQRSGGGTMGESGQAPAGTRPSRVEAEPLGLRTPS